jgi:hypothetical protein
VKLEPNEALPKLAKFVNVQTGPMHISGLSTIHSVEALSAPDTSVDSDDSLNMGCPLLLNSSIKVAKVSFGK